MQTIDQSVLQAKAELAIGGGLVTTPLWAILLRDISLIASTIAAVCGAIVGVHAVYRLKRHKRESRR